MHKANEERILELERQVKALEIYCCGLERRIDALEGKATTLDGDPLPTGGGGPGPEEGPGGP